MKFIASSISLVIVNLIPLFGAIFLGWDLTTLLIIYWSENIAIGFWNVLKLMKAPRINDINNKYHFSVEEMEESKRNEMNKPENLSKFVTMFTLFFIVHYGLFTFIHGVFIFTIGLQTSNNFLSYLPAVIFSFLLIFLSHGISYFLNFIGKKEYESTSASELMIKPYKRIFTTHFVVFIVFAALKDSNSPMISAFILIIIKTIGDLIFHNIEHVAASSKWK